MFTLKLDEITEEGLNLKWEEGQADVMAYVENFSQIDFEIDSPLAIEARVWKVGQSVLVKGNVKALLQVQCVRCLQRFSYPLSSPFDLTLLPAKGASLEEETELKEEEMESSFFEGGEIRLSEIACEQIFLEIPYQLLCHGACKGLCPICGKDLNVFSCGCMKEEFESGFSVLRKLKLD